ncbi:hypothetical protein ACTFIU_011495 [Dictyostelium citrinum]
MKSIIKISLNVLIISGGQTCPESNNPCIISYYFYGSCFNVYNQFVDCESTKEYNECVSNCKKSQRYNPCSSVSCNFETFACEYGRYWNGCEDLNKCTMDSCNSTISSCTHSPINCNDNNNSTIDNCLPTFGCYYSINPLINGIKKCLTNSNCNDNRSCSTDQCINGKCHYTLNCPSGYACNTNGKCDIIPQPTN